MHHLNVAHNIVFSLFFFMRCVHQKRYRLCVIYKIHIVQTKKNHGPHATIERDSVCSIRHSR